MADYYIIATVDTDDNSKIYYWSEQRWTTNRDKALSFGASKGAKAHAEAHINLPYWAIIHCDDLINPLNIKEALFGQLCE